MNNLFRKKPANVPAPEAPVVGTAGSLREFVYLDEVSVYSLTSAPDKPPPVSMSESADSTSGETLSSQIEGGAPLVAKATVGAELTSNRSNGLQVQRQFNIQSQFARLHGRYHPTFLLRATAPPTELLLASSLENALLQLQTKQRAIRASELTRGALTELRVSLSAHHTFDITAFLQVMTGLFEKYPRLLGVQDFSGLQAAMDAGAFLAELLDDLVPVEGRSTTHHIVTDPSGVAWIADIEALEFIWPKPVATEPLRVVGVAETASFWKDTRRILHAEAEFDVLGRVSRTGLQDQWTPVKMIDTFKRVMPSAANGLLEAVDQLRYIPEESAPSAQKTAIVIAAEHLNLNLARHHEVEGAELSPELLLSLMEDGDDSLERSLATLTRVADSFYAIREGLERNEDQVGLLRQEAWRGAQAVMAAQPGAGPASPPVSQTPVLELEFVAMYW